MCGHNLTMKFPPDFHNYTKLNGLLNSPSSNLLLLHQISWFLASDLPDLQKGEKNIWEVVARRCSAKTLSWKSDKMYKEIPVLESLSEEAVVQRCSVKKQFLKISQNSQENTCARVIVGKGAHNPTFSRSTPPFQRFPLSRNPGCPYFL